MEKKQGIPRGASIAIDDMLDHCAQIQPGQEVLLLAHTDGLYGGDSLVDEQAIPWIQMAIGRRGAKPSILWIDEPVKAHAWRVPPVVKAAVGGCDVLINHSFDIVTEEIIELRDLILKYNIILVRNFATTAPLLCTDWAQTPYELVSEIRYYASIPFKEGVSWELTHTNGTHLEGRIAPSKSLLFPSYTTRRLEVGGYRPWPEWVIPPINITDTSGIFIFDKMLSWWSRYIGISPFFNEPIQLTIENCRITKIDGGREADALRRFLASMMERVGEGVYDFKAIHCGVHPNAEVGPHQCSSANYRRLIEHAHVSNIHVHIGAPPITSTYPYWMHCTGDIRDATWRVGDELVHDRGRLKALAHPAVFAVAERYPGRPGLQPAHLRY